MDASNRFAIQDSDSEGGRSSVKSKESGSRPDVILPSSNPMHTQQQHPFNSLDYNMFLNPNKKRIASYDPADFENRGFADSDSRGSRESRESRRSRRSHRSHRSRRSSRSSHREPDGSRYESDDYYPSRHERRRSRRSHRSHRSHRSSHHHEPRHEPVVAVQRTVSKDSFAISQKPKSTQDIRLRKKELLANLADLENMGYIMQEKYTMDNTVEEMEAEIKLCDRLFGERFMREKATEMFFQLFFIVEGGYVIWNPLNLKLTNLTKNLQTQQENIAYEIARVVKLFVGDSGTNPFFSLILIIVSTLITTHMTNWFEDQLTKNPEKTGENVGNFLHGIVKSFTPKNPNANSGNFAGNPSPKPPTPAANGVPGTEPAAPNPFDAMGGLGGMAMQFLPALMSSFGGGAPMGGAPPPRQQQTGPPKTNSDIQNLLHRPMTPGRMEPIPPPMPSTVYSAGFSPIPPTPQASVGPQGPHVPMGRIPVPAPVVPEQKAPEFDRFDEVSSISSAEHVPEQTPKRRRRKSTHSSQSSMTTVTKVRNKDGSTTTRRVLEL